MTRLSTTQSRVLAWQPDLRSVIGWSVLVALILSTQFLAQLFVWRNWEVNEIFQSWFLILRDRLIMTFSIAMMILLAGRLPILTLHGKAILLAAAIITGAFASELLLTRLAGNTVSVGFTFLLGQVIRWSITAIGIAAMFYLSRQSEQNRQKIYDFQLRDAQLERQLTEARLQMLKAQIEPHFLFNTLATIRQLHRQDSAQGNLILTNFLDYLRAALPKMRERQTSLGDELQLVCAYLSVVAVRMSGRLTWSIDVAGELQDQHFPPMSLATLVENAVKHGIGPSAEGGSIFVTAQSVESLAGSKILEVAVTDTGVGFSGGSGNGIGLANTRARLTNLYGPHASLKIEAHVPHGMRATIRIPLAA